MKSRAQIKAEAMAGFQRNYWPAVGILLLGAFITNAVSLIPVGGLILAPLVMVGIANVSLQIYRQWQTGTGELFTPFYRFGRVLGGMLWMQLWLFIWALIALVPLMVALTAAASVVGEGGMSGDLLWLSPAYADMLLPTWRVMPGLVALTTVLQISVLVITVIKGLQYFCTQYILADSPNVPATKALALSKKMMAGHKADIFVAGLSFIGWFILCGLTFGILWIFYVGPYWFATMAGFYNTIKWDAFNRGILTPEDFGESPQLYAQQEWQQQQYRDQQWYYGQQHYNYYNQPARDTDGPPKSYL